MPKSSLSEKLKGIKSKTVKANSNPLWLGPSSKEWNGGVTQGLLSRYLSCQERFRVQYLEGWHPKDKFSAALEFGNLWHACEESLASQEELSDDRGNDWQVALLNYGKKLCAKYPLQQQEVNEWMLKAKAMFPVYIDYWSKHPDVVARMPLLQEQTFDTPYDLPSGRVVRLRGKWDSVDLVEQQWDLGNGKKLVKRGIWLVENKTKSQIDSEKIARQLAFDLQTLFYLIALKEEQNRKTTYESNGVWTTRNGQYSINGVRYNVVRRSAHKSIASLQNKLTEDLAGGRAGEWFARWNVEITNSDLDRFKRECLNPVLENLCDDYEFWVHAKPDHVFDYQYREKVFPSHRLRHYRMPYCGYSPLAEGGFGDVDHYLESGSTMGLERREKLFSELEEEV